MANLFDRNYAAANKTSFEQIENISRESGVPINVLIALGERAKVEKPEDLVEFSRTAAGELAPALQAGGDIQQIIRDNAGDQADSFLARAREIGMELYPDRMNAGQAQRNAEAAAQGRRSIGENIKLGAPQLAEGWISGAGYKLKALGLDDAGQRLVDFAQSQFGLSEEEQARSQAIALESTIGQEIVDGFYQALIGIGVDVGVSAAGAKTGAKIGAIAGPKGALAGGLIGAFTGAAISIYPQMVASAWQRAEQNGADMDDPEEQYRALGTGALTSVAQIALPGAAGYFLTRPVTAAATGIGRNIAGNIGKAGAFAAMTEGSAEALAVIIEAVRHDKDLRAAMSDEDYAAILPLMLEKEGRNIIVAGGIGALMGGGIGGATGGIDAARVNAKVNADQSNIHPLFEGIWDEATSLNAGDAPGIPAQDHHAFMRGVLNELNGAEFALSQDANADPTQGRSAREQRAYEKGVSWARERGAEVADGVKARAESETAEAIAQAQAEEAAQQEPLSAAIDERAGADEQDPMAPPEPRPGTLSHAALEGARRAAPIQPNTGAELGVSPQAGMPGGEPQASEASAVAAAPQDGATGQPVPAILQIPGDSDTPVEIIAQSEEGLQVVDTETGEVYDIPRADIEAGLVNVVPMGQPDQPVSMAPASEAPAGETIPPQAGEYDLAVQEMADIAGKLTSVGQAERTLADIDVLAREFGEGEDLRAIRQTLERYIEQQEAQQRDAEAAQQAEDSLIETPEADDAEGADAPTLGELGAGTQGAPDAGAQPDTIAKPDGTPFKSASALRSKIARDGLDVDQYDITERDGGFVAVRKAESEPQADLSDTSEPQAAEPTAAEREIKRLKDKMMRLRRDKPGSEELRQVEADLRRARQNAFAEDGTPQEPTPPSTEGEQTDGIQQGQQEGLREQGRAEEVATEFWTGLPKSERPGAGRINTDVGSGFVQVNYGDFGTSVFFIPKDTQQPQVIAEPKRGRTRAEIEGFLDPSRYRNTPTQEPDAGAQSASTDPVEDAAVAGVQAGLVRHTTKKGKTLSGYVVKGINQAQAKEIDPHTFKKDGGWFVRKARMDEAGAKAETPTAEQFDQIAAETDPSPTPAQAEAENYKTGKTDWRGLRLSFENRKGTERKGIGRDGKEWSVTMPAHYGRILRTEGADGDHVDFYMGENPDSDRVFVVDQKDAETGKFDEHKVMLGFNTQKEAKDAYLAGFSDGKGRERWGGVTAMSVADLGQIIGDKAKWQKPMKMVEPQQASDSSAQPETGEPIGHLSFTAISYPEQGETLDGLLASYDEALKDAGLPQLLVDDRRRPSFPGGGEQGATVVQDRASVFIPLFKRGDRKTAMEAINSVKAVPYGKQRPNRTARQFTGLAPAEAGAQSGADSLTQTQRDVVSGVHRAVKPENQDGTGFYTSGQIDVQIDPDMNGDATITVTSTRSWFEGRAKKTETQSKRAKFSEIRDQLREPSLGILRSIAAETDVGDTPQDFDADKLVDDIINEIPDDANEGGSPAPQAEQESPDGDSGAQAGGKRKPKVQDFGKKITGTRKDAAKKYTEDLAGEINTATMGLSDAFPMPDFQALDANGVSPDTMALVAALRANIGRKPTKSWQVRDWVDHVNDARQYASDLLSGKKLPDQVIKEIKEAGRYPLRMTTNDIGGLMALRHVKPENMGWAANNLKIDTASVRQDGGDYVTHYGVVKRDRNLFASQVVRGDSVTVTDLEADADKLAQVIDGWAEGERDKRSGARGGASEKPAEFEIRTWRRKGGAAIFVSKPRIIQVSGEFPNTKAARAYMNDNREALEAELARLLEGPRERRDSNRERKGPAWRTGDATEAMFTDKLGFRGVTFGKSLTASDRQSRMNDTYDAMMDLAGMLGVPPKMLSLGGRLGLGFGTHGKGGRGHWAAVYIQSSDKNADQVIALTKGAGAGTLAHEWWHAVDNFLAREDAVDSNLSAAQTGDKGRARTDFMTDRRGRNRGSLDNETIVSSFEDLRRALDRSDWKKRMMRFDEAKGKPYYGTTIELAARAFEKMVVDNLDLRDMQNDFLANIDQTSGAYLTTQELRRSGIGAAFDKVLGDIKAHLNVEGKDGPKLPDIIPERVDEGPKVGDTWESADGWKEITDFSPSTNMFTITNKADNTTKRADAESVEDIKELDAFNLTDEGQARRAEREAAAAAEEAAKEDNQKKQEARQALRDRYDPMLEAYGRARGKKNIDNVRRQLAKSYNFVGLGGSYNRGMMIMKLIEDGEKVRKSSVSNMVSLRGFGTETFTKVGMDFAEWYQGHWEQQQALYNKTPEPEAETPPAADAGAPDEFDADKLVSDILDEIPDDAPDQAAPSLPPETEAVRAAFLEAFQEGRRFSSIVQARKLASETLGRKIEEADYLTIEEAIELAVVQRARELVEANRGDAVATYAELIDLYNGQPILGERTPDKMIHQAYSTPAPLAYVASRLAGIGEGTRVWEPTAGNGMLAIEANPRLTQANELQPTRAAQLRVALGEGAIVTEADATEVKPGPFDVLIANPPFGAVFDNDSRKRKEWPMGVTTTKTVDHAISWGQLENMPDDGRATLIIGGVKKQLEGDDRKKAYQERANTSFFKQLYDTYNVVDHFTVAGNLYSRQGAAWPVDVIVIDGRAPSSRDYPMKTPPDVLSTWAEIGRKLNDAPDMDTTERGAASDSVSPDPEGGTVNAGSLSGAAGEQIPQGDTGGQRGRAEPIPADRGELGGSDADGPDTNASSGNAGAGKRGGRSSSGGRSGTVSRPSEGNATSTGQRGSDGDGLGGSDNAPISSDGVTPPRTAGEAAQSAAVNVQKAGAEALAALNALFNDPNKLGSGLSFDKAAYEKAKPHFIAAARAFGKAGQDVADVIRAVVKAFLEAGYNKAAIKPMSPLLSEFAREVNAGKVTIWEQDQPAPKKNDAPKDAETEFQVSYKVRSEAKFQVGTLVPKGMQNAMQRALDRIAQEHGNIDSYVARELGYTVDQVVGSDSKPGYFSAEQVDALAMAIDNVSKGKGFIIGDQTGVGKGRFVAAMLRYGAKKGKIPVFVTQKPGLYADMVRDMRDIGMDGVESQIIATNAAMPPVEISGPDDMFKGAKPKELTDLFTALRSGKMPDGKSYLFTTYDQMRAQKEVWPDRARALLASAPNTMLVLDESHTAGGSASGATGWDGPREPGQGPRNTAEFFRDMVQQSSGSVFSSATYAKSPAVMSLYSSTDLSLAVSDVNKLGAAIERGGVPLQQVVANQLTEAGQYVRRERSFDGVEFNAVEMQTDRGNAVKISETISALAMFDRETMEPVRAEVSENLQELGYMQVGDSSVGVAAVSSAPFASTVHNLVNQFLLAAKLDATVDTAIAAWRRGEKPVMTLMNVNTSIINDFIEANGLRVGDEADIPFTTIVDRYLERLRQVTVEDTAGNKTRIRISDEDLGVAAVSEFNEMKRMVRNLPISNLSGSPVDAIMDKMRAAGMKVDEITGRQTVIENGILASRGNNASENKKRMNAFNRGDLDALILSASGSTGFSLHATGLKGNDGKQRHMIVLQPHADINVFMQTLGRVHRTGQIKLPKYSLAFSDLAVEKRLAAVLMRKMSSLNANTTAGKDSAVTLKEVTDFVNEVGDSVMMNYLRQDEYLTMRLGVGSKVFGKDASAEDLARIASGRFIYLHPDEAQQHFEAIEQAYTDRLAELEQEGRNPLEAKVLDLQAKTIASEILREGQGSTSPLDQSLVMERASIKRPGNPYTTSEVQGMVEKSLGGKTPEAWASAKGDELRALMPQHLENLREVKDQREAAFKAAQQAETTAKDALEKASRELEQAKSREASKEELLPLDKAEAAAKRAVQKAQRATAEAVTGLDTIENRIKNENTKLENIITAISGVTPGKGFTLTTPDGQVAAIVIDADTSKLGRNPTAAGKIRVRFAVSDASREAAYSLHAIMNQEGSVTFEHTLPGIDPLSAFSNTQADVREERFIATGNLIAGMEQFNKSSGQVVIFTRENGDEVPGILMPRSFDLRTEMEGQDVSFPDAKSAVQFMRDYDGVIKSADKAATISYSNFQFHLEIKKNGGRAYFLLQPVQQYLQSPREKGRFYQAKIRFEDIEAAMGAYEQNLGTSWLTDSKKDEARRLLGIEMPTIGSDARESRFDPDLTPTATRDITRSVSSELRRSIPGSKVTAKVVRGLANAAGAPIQGRQRGASIEVNPDSADGVIGTLRHEIVHLLRDAGLWGKPYGLFTRAEWQGLVAAARADKALMARIDRMYPDLGQSARLEEGVAELYRLWARNMDQRSGLDRAFQKMRALFQALVSAFRGQGFNSTAQTFERIASGAVGGRGPDGPQGAGSTAQDRFSVAPATDSPAFRRWFGDSKVVDAEGKPQVAYRAMDRDVKGGAFSISEGGTYGDGIYLTTDPSYANEFAGRDGGQVFPVYVSIQNPAPEALVERIEAEATASRRSSREILKDMGYDGMIAADGEILAFEPAQIKSVYNRGTFNPSDPRISESRFDPARRPDGRFASKAAQYSRQLLGDGGKITGTKERGLLGNFLTDMMGGKSGTYNTLALVPGEPLFQEMGKHIPSAQKYLKMKHALSAMRNEMQASASKFMDDWRGFARKNSQANDRMMALMHDATLQGVDPAERFTMRSRRTNEGKASYAAEVEAKRLQHEELKKRFDRLPKEARDIYRGVRDGYKEMSRLERQIIMDNVAKAMEINVKRAQQKYDDTIRELDEDGITGDARAEKVEIAKQALMQVKKRDGYGRKARLQSLRLMFEQNEVEAPYFPLMRHGNYYATVKNDAGQILSFSKFETERARDQAAAQLKRDFPEHEIKTGAMSSKDSRPPEVDPNFMSDVQAMIGATTADTQLMDSIWQRYLETLPDFSIRKSRIHRKGTPGYSRDAFRNYAKQMFHGAFQLSRLKYGQDMQLAIEDAQREAQEANDPTRSTLVVNEMEKRHQWIMNPQTSAWSTWATSAAFVYYLGATPAAAMVNLSQSVIVGMPVLSAAFEKGTIAGAGRHLMRGLREFSMAKGRLLNSKHLKPDEKEALQRAYDAGVIEKSQAHDLAGMQESGVEYSDIRQKWMRPIAYMFHHSERMNREITFMAAYRMAKESGQVGDTAYTNAARLTWKSHFNYESDSRPRLQFNDTVRVATVFRNYQLNMLYRLFRDSHQMMQGETEADRKEARAQLIGITGMMMLMAGFTGTWGYALMTTLLGQFKDGGADEIEEEIKEALVNTLGIDVAGMILKGVPGHLTGVDLSNRIGMPELWFRRAQRQEEGQELYDHWFEQLVGAVPAMASSVFRGASMASEGEIYRGIETAAPKFVRDYMRSYRYSTDGVTTYRGNPIIEDISAQEALTQAIGFTPARISERYQTNRFMKNEEMRIRGQRTRLMAQAYADIKEGKPLSERTKRAIAEFNSEYPTYPITADTLRQSFRSRARGEIETVDGVRINNRLNQIIREGRAPMLYNQ